MVKGLCELLWLEDLLTEVGFPPDSTMNLFCNNKDAIDISHNPIQHNHTKHVEIDRHFVKQNMEEKIIQFPFVKYEDQLDDILTKTVSSRNINDSLDNSGIREIFTHKLEETVGVSLSIRKSQIASYRNLRFKNSFNQRSVIIVAVNIVQTLSSFLK